MTDWFHTLSRIVGRHEPAADARALPRAAAALMLELAMIDDGIDPAEMDIVHRAMMSAFGLRPAELGELLEQASAARDGSVSLHEFTTQLRTAMTPGDRADLVEWMWRVAWADERLGAHEEHLVRRIADLLAVPHAEFIRRKLAAKPA